MDSDNVKEQTIKQDEKISAFEKQVNSNSSIKGRPNIDEISKRNKQEEERDRNSSYIKTGIIILLTIGAILLIYFFI